MDALRARMLHSVPWFILSGMTAMCLLQGVPVHSGDPGFPKAMDNVTVRQGDSAILRCMVDNRVTRVAWLNRSTILYTGNDKWSIDPRVILVANTKSQFSIEIQNVDVYDEGPYTCSVQTDHHPKTSRVHLIVQVPPRIVEISSNIAVNEGNNVSLSCIATGRPEPVVNWRYLSPKAHGFMSEDEYLEITGITRDQSGLYECSAANDVASPDVRRVKVTVNYPPYILDARNIGVPLGHQGILQCDALAMPAAEFFWYKEEKRLTDSRKGVKVENRETFSRVTFFNVSEQDYGNYTCVAMNRLGHSNASVLLFEIYQPTSSPLLQEETTAALTPLKGPGAVHDGNSGSPPCLLCVPLSLLLSLLCLSLLLPPAQF